MTMGHYYSQLTIITVTEIISVTLFTNVPNCMSIALIVTVMMDVTYR